LEAEVLKYQQSLHEYMKKISNFSDWDFEGSNLNAITRLMAVNAFNMNHMGRMVNNESFMDSANLKQSVVSHSTTLNYIPLSRSSPRFKLKISVEAPDRPDYIRIPKYYKFRGVLYGKNITFITLNDYISINGDADNVYTFDEVVVYVGDLVEETFIIKDTNISNGFTTYKYPLIIQSSEVDINTLEVFVESIDSPPIIFSRREELGNVSPDSNVYFIRGIYDDNYTIEFGDGRFGKPLKDNDKVIIRYISVSDLLIPENISINKSSDLGPYSKIAVESSELITQGTERESIESIRRSATKGFQSQHRAVSQDDYSILIKKQFPNIHHVHTFGGEEIQQYGKVIISLKPKNGEVVSNIIKRQIISFLKDKNIIIDPMIIDPDIYHLGCNANISFRMDLDNNFLMETQIKSSIISKLSEVGEEIFSGFGINIHQSDINNIINSSHPSITGSSINLYVYKRWFPTRNIINNLRFDIKSKITNKEVKSNIFQFWGGERIQNGKFIVKDGLVLLADIQETGDEVLFDAPVGFVDYENGYCEIDFEFYDYNQFIEIGFALESDMFKSNQNSFAIFNPARVNLELSSR